MKVSDSPNGFHTATSSRDTATSVTSRSYYAGDRKRPNGASSHSTLTPPTIMTDSTAAEKVAKLPLLQVREEADGPNSDGLNNTNSDRRRASSLLTVYRDVELDGVMTPLSTLTVHDATRKSKASKYRERSVLLDKDKVESDGWWQDTAPGAGYHHSASSVTDPDGWDWTEERDLSPDHMSTMKFGETRGTARWPWHRHAVGETMGEDELCECITRGIQSVVISQRKPPRASSLKSRITTNLHEIRGSANEMRGKIGHLFDFDVCKEKFIGDPKTPFDFAAYAPRAFRRLREINGVSEEQYVHWICDSPIIGINTRQSAGKSPALFWYSHDRRYILKSLTHEETSMLRSFIGRYTRHLETENPHSLLSRFYGLYKLTIHGNMTIRFVVMGNVFHGPSQDRMFDLKGTTEDRLVRVPSSDEPGKVMMKDLNFTESFCMIPQVADLFMDTVRKDVDFLCSFGLMDYSLIVGIRELPKEEDPIELDTASPFTAFHGGIQGWSWEEGASTATSLVYRIGIIDFLQLWTGWKTAAHLMKKITIGCCHEIDTEPPHVYRARFLRYVNSKTMKVPTFRKIFMENTSMKHRLQVLEDENAQLRKKLGLDGKNVSSRSRENSVLSSKRDSVDE